MRGTLCPLSARSAPLPVEEGRNDGLSARRLPREPPGLFRAFPDVDPLTGHSMIDDDFSEHRPRRERDAQTPSKWLPPEEYVEDEVNPNEGLPFARKWRMAVLGGSFDPVHLGHIRLARKVQEQDWADEVLFVPAKRSPFKGEAMMDTGRHRMEMLDLAIQDALAEKPAFSRLRPDGSTAEREYPLRHSDPEHQRPSTLS